jgi:hypothetical protein
MFLGNLEHNCLVMRGMHDLGGGRRVVREVRFWAERGLIHCEDSLDNSYSSTSVREFLTKFRALSRMLGNSSSAKDRGPEGELRSAVQQWIDKAIEIARQAQEQGMPDDPAAARAALRARRTVVQVAGGGFMT